MILIKHLESKYAHVSLFVNTHIIITTINCLWLCWVTLRFYCYSLRRVCKFLNPVFISLFISLSVIFISLYFLVQRRNILLKLNFPIFCFTWQILFTAGSNIRLVLRSSSTSCTWQIVFAIVYFEVVFHNPFKKFINMSPLCL